MFSSFSEKRISKTSAVGYEVVGKKRFLKGLKKNEGEDESSKIDKQY